MNQDTNNILYQWDISYTPSELTPPVSSMTALPEISSLPLKLQWTGSDSGGSKLRNFDVQYKDGIDGTWENLLPWFFQTEGYMNAGIGGHTYYFRVRGRDYAYNLKSWPSTYDAVTTIENLPPESSVAALPRVAKSPLPIVFTGVDVGGSLIDTYDVRVYDENDPGWLDLHSNSTITTSDFLGSLGHTYLFQSRGKRYCPEPRGVSLHLRCHCANLRMGCHRPGHRYRGYSAHGCVCIRQFWDNGCGG